MFSESQIEGAAMSACVSLIENNAAIFTAAIIGGALAIMPHGAALPDGARSLGIRLTASMTPTRIESAIRRALA